jgi:hypothetical protein
VARLPLTSGLSAVVLEVVPLQQLTWALAGVRGLTVESFRHHQDDTKLPQGGSGAAGLTRPDTMT